MLTEPVVFTISGAAKSCNRVSTEGTSSTYKTADDEVEFRASHATDKSQNKRSLLQVTQTKVASDPISSANKSVDQFVQIVFSRPPFGFTVAETDALWAAAKAKFDTAFTTEVLGGEH